MRALLGVAFAILLALELVLLFLVVAVIANGAAVGWRDRPVTTVVLGLVLLLAGVGLWRSHRIGASAGPELAGLHPGINFSRVPTSGAAGAIFMLQFVIWFVAAPAVGLLYAVLIAGGLALLPVAWYLNRRRAGGVARVGLGSILGVVAALLCASLVPFRHTPLAWILPIAVPAGVLGAGVLIWKRSDEKHPSIAPYQQ